MKFVLQRRLARRFAGLYCLDIVSPRQVRVGRRIPDAVIHAVGNAEEPVANGAEHAVEPRAELRSLDLASVGLAYGVDQVGEDDATLEEAELPVELQLIAVEEPPIQPGQLHVPPPEQSLVGNVVD